MTFFNKKKQKNDIPQPTIIEGNSISPVVLISLDGWGAAPPSDGNAITSAKTPNIDSFYSNYPHGELIASGESVGLPANEVGNSEVGHLTMGIGTVLQQSLNRISKSIEDETYYENPAFLATAKHVRNFNSKLHLMGLVSTGSVHSSLDHFYALLEFCRKVGLKNVCLHLFTDGRDAPPTNGKEVIEKIQQHIEKLGFGKICTISGRYYAMDRDMRWKRTQLAYDAITQGKGITANSAVEAMQASYAVEKTDEFVEPTVIYKDGRPVGTVDDNDGVIFFNFRVDRPRQLTMAFVMSNFENLGNFEMGHDPDQGKVGKQVAKGSTFKREKWPKNIFFTTMTEYQKEVAVSAIAFPPLKAKTSLSKVVSEAGLKQLHLTESEKERMVTIYFDGLVEGGYPGSDTIIIPSPRVATYDKKPQMSIYKIVDEFKKQILRNNYHFIIMNFANPDMVAHSGNVKATIKAIEHVDKALGVVSREILARNGTLLISADHGNAEELLTFPNKSYFFTTSTGDVNTDHSNNPVPLHIISNTYKGKPIKLPKGALSDIAPTILSIMNLPIPSEMTGNNLLATDSDKRQNSDVSAKPAWVQPDI